MDFRIRSFPFSSFAVVLARLGFRARGRRASAIRTALVFVLLCLTSCQTLRHQFVQPTPNWQSKWGQLQYRGPRTSLIGDVLIRYSSRGDFELTFSKGPGVTLLTVRQDDRFVRVSGPLAHGSWSGSPNEAPVRLRGWISLRPLFLQGKTEAIVRETAGRDSFTFAF
ncbi:MAG: hypothetical protein ACREIF_05270 [Chthoniobacterales bacterium]